MTVATSRRLILRGALFGVACACAGAGARVAYAADEPPRSPKGGAPSGKWTCPPCGCASDGKAFDAPGVCPEAGCGMDLIPMPRPEPKGGDFLVGGAL